MPDTMVRYTITILLFTTLIACKKGEESYAKEITDSQLVNPDKVVAKDGTGDYTTIQAAVDAAPANQTKYYTIFIKDGSYKEVVTIPTGKNYIFFKGESHDKTILTYDNYAGKIHADGTPFGTSRTASVFIKATNFRAENITFANSSGIDAGQALAISIQGDRAAFTNCRFLGHQDTYYAATNTTQYLKNCFIEGTVDFMFGGSTAVFENCTLNSLRNGYITAASTPQGKKYGYVFINCNLTGTAPDASVYLGRPWRPYAKVVYINCKMGKHIKPEGWNNWNNTANEATAFYAEYQSTGLGYQQGKRVSWSQQLTNEQAKEYTIEKITGSWNPF